MDTIMLGEIIKSAVIFALAIVVTFIIVKSFIYSFLRIIEDFPELFPIMQERYRSSFLGRIYCIIIRYGILPALIIGINIPTILMWKYIPQLATQFWNSLTDWNNILTLSIFFSFTISAVYLDAYVIRWRKLIVEAWWE